eukprot:SAG11_NODE_458_length_9290_cov_2.641388_6_plen_166_part_00
MSLTLSIRRAIEMRSQWSAAQCRALRACAMLGSADAILVSSPMPSAQSLCNARECISSRLMHSINTTFSSYGASCEACLAPNAVVDSDRTSCQPCSAGSGPSMDRTGCIACDGTHMWNGVLAVWRVHVMERSTRSCGVCNPCDAPNVVDVAHSSCMRWCVRHPRA